MDVENVSMSEAKPPFQNDSNSSTKSSDCVENVSMREAKPPFQNDSNSSAKCSDSVEKVSKSEAKPPFQNDSNSRTKSSDSDSDKNDPVSPQGCWRKCTTKTNRFLDFVALEILVFQIGFGNSMHISLEENALFRHSCVDKMNLTNAVCYGKSQDQESLKLVEKAIMWSTDIKIIFSLIEFFLTSLVSVSYCTWSDETEKRHPLIIALFFLILQSVGLLASSISSHDYLYPAFSVIALTSLGGGHVTITAMIHSYVSLYSSLKWRTMRFATVDSAFIFGRVIGNLVYIHLPDDIVPVIGMYGIYVMLRITAFGWALATIKNSRTGSPIGRKESLKSLLSFKNCKKCIESMYMPRRNCGEEQVILLIFSVISIMLAYGPMEGISYFDFLHSQAFQDIREYGNTSVFCTLGGSILVVFAVYIIHHMLRQGDPALGIVGTMALIAANVGKSVSFKASAYYSALSISPFSGLAAVAARSRYSKLSDKNEYGKLFLFFSISENSSTLTGYIVFVKLHQHLKDIVLHIPYLIVSVLLIFPLSVFVWQLSLLSDQQLEKYPLSMHSIQELIANIHESRY